MFILINNNIIYNNFPIFHNFFFLFNYLDKEERERNIILIYYFMK